MNNLSNTINYHGHALDTKLGGFLNKLQGSTDKVARGFVSTTEVFRSSIRRFQSEITQLSNNTNVLLQSTNTSINYTSSNLNRQTRIISGRLKKNLDSTNNFINELDSNLGAFLRNLANVANHFQGDIANEAKNLIAAVDKGIQTGKFKPEVHANTNVKAKVCTIM